jgi:hypothetical protein
MSQLYFKGMVPVTDIEMCHMAIRIYFQTRARLEEVDMSERAESCSTRDSGQLASNGGYGLIYGAYDYPHTRLCFTPEAGFSIARSGMEPKLFQKFQRFYLFELAAAGLPVRRTK